MRHRCRFQRWGLQALEILWLLVMSSPLCDAAQRLSVTPPTIKINSFFGGAEVSVSAEIPQGCEAVIEVTGKKLEEDLMRKGRRWDLWMNVGEIDIDGAPCLYLLMSSAPRLLKTGNTRSRTLGRCPACHQRPGSMRVASAMVPNVPGSPSLAQKLAQWTPCQRRHTPRRVG